MFSHTTEHQPHYLVINVVWRGMLGSVRHNIIIHHVQATKTLLFKIQDAFKTTGYDGVSCKYRCVS